MKRHPSPALLSAVLGVALFALGGAARAEGSPNPEAVQHFKAGMTKFRAADYQGAIHEWRIAEAIEESPGLDYNLAVAYKKAGDSQHALRYYERFLTIAAPDDPDRADAQANVSTLQAQLGPGGTPADQSVPDHAVPVPDHAAPPPPPPNMDGADHAAPPPGPGFGPGTPPVAGPSSSGFAQGGPAPAGYAPQGPPPTYAAGGSSQPPQPMYAPNGAPPPGYGAAPPPAYGMPVATLAAPPTLLDAAPLAFGVDLGPTLSAGIVDSSLWAASLGARFTLDINLHSHGLWLFGVVNVGSFAGRYSDPSTGAAPSVAFTQLGGGAMWVHRLAGNLYFAPRGALAVGELLAFPNGNDSSQSASYTNTGVLADAELLYVMGASVFRFAPIAIDYISGNHYVASSNVPDVINGGRSGINISGSAYQMWFGWSYLF